MFLDKMCCPIFQPPPTMSCRVPTNTFLRLIFAYCTSRNVCQSLKAITFTSKRIKTAKGVHTQYSTNSAQKVIWVVPGITTVLETPSTPCRCLRQLSRIMKLPLSVKGSRVHSMGGLYEYTLDLRTIT